MSNVIRRPEPVPELVNHSDRIRALELRKSGGGAPPPAQVFAAAAAAFWTTSDTWWDTSGASMAFTGALNLTALRVPTAANFGTCTVSGFITLEFNLPVVPYGPALLNFGTLDTEAIAGFSLAPRFYTAQSTGTDTKGQTNSGAVRAQLLYDGDGLIRTFVSTPTGYFPGPSGETKLEFALTFISKDAAIP